MIKVFLFIFRYKIKKDGANLSNRCREFFMLPLKSQKKVLDIYFDNIDDDFKVGFSFDNKNARYYENGREISFFSSFYFCKKLIEFNINNIVYFDKFDISDDEKTSLINFTLQLIKKKNLKIKISNILVYPDRLPKVLAMNIDFMNYIISVDNYNVKYIEYNEKNAEEQRNLIRGVIKKIKDDDFSIEKFMVNGKILPKVLVWNVDFLIYIIENDIDNIMYLEDKILDNFTYSDIKRIIRGIEVYINKYEVDFEFLFNNTTMGKYLNKDCEFLNFIINIDVDNIKYVDFHNIVNSDLKNIIDKLALKLVKEGIDFDCDKYPFNNILKQNYMFMAYMIDKDRHNIKMVSITKKNEIDRIVDIYLNKYRKCEFEIDDYLDDQGLIKNIFVENKYMLSYLIRQDNRIFKYIDFLSISNADDVIDVIMREMHHKYFVFDNSCFLRDGKYPIILSNSYRFMKYVIDDNFNNLSYIDAPLVDKGNLRKIINYAFRLVYYIRGDNKRLNFDIDGYFKGSSIIEEDYFQECLASLQ